MKRFLAWLRRPQLYVQFVEPRKRTNPLAQQAVESLQEAVARLSRMVDLVEQAQKEVARLREELTAYAAAAMEPDAQVADLERLRTKETR